MSERPVLVVRPEDGSPYPGVGTLTCKIPSSATGNAFTALELTLQPGEGAPLHVHQREDEIVFIQEGNCTVGQRDQEWSLLTGSWITFPRHTAHFFRNNSSEACTLLITAIPGGLDNYFSSINEALDANQPEKINAINTEFGLTFFDS
jgi:quercetin dioxygenase-like cupin family protein